MLFFKDGCRFEMAVCSFLYVCSIGQACVVEHNSLTLILHEEHRVTLVQCY